jgi:hypothetical protein
MQENIIHSHRFSFSSEECNGGEDLYLTTDFIDNGDDGPEGILLMQELSLQGYSNSASFSLCGISLTPEILRKLANELDRALIEADTKRTKGE